MPWTFLMSYIDSLLPSKWLWVWITVSLLTVSLNYSVSFVEYYFIVGSLPSCCCCCGCCCYCRSKVSCCLVPILKPLNLPWTTCPRDNRCGSTEPSSVEIWSTSGLVWRHGIVCVTATMYRWGQSRCGGERVWEPTKKIWRTCHDASVDVSRLSIGVGGVLYCT